MLYIPSKRIGARAIRSATGKCYSSSRAEGSPGAARRGASYKTVKEDNHKK
jgi:hypothetical protein